RALRARRLRGARDDGVLLLSVRDQVATDSPGLGGIRAARTSRPAARSRDARRGARGHGGHAVHPARRSRSHARLLAAARGDGGLLPWRVVPHPGLRAPRPRPLPLLPPPPPPPHP